MKPGFLPGSMFERTRNGTKIPSIGPRLSLYRIFEQFTCYKDDEHCMTPAEEGGVVPLPFSCSFSRHPNSENIVAVANEDGKVHLIDTTKAKDSCVKTWQAHVNAVFDIAWVAKETKLVTGSGDQTAQLWDVETGKCLSVFKGHTCSLRSISFKHQDTNVFATGARDGNIMIWDTRSKLLKSGYYKPVNILYGVHTVSSNARRNTSVRNESQQSVTTVLFKDEHSLYSSGAADGAVKLWDMRRYYTNVKGVPQAKHVYPYVGTASRKHGISCLSLTSCRSLLFSSCTDDHIYMYNTHIDTKNPVGVFTGHTNTTFYVKSSVTLDNRFLVSGSSTHSIHVWDIEDPNLAPVTLQGHSGEVTSVTCSNTDMGKIVSCSDDSTVRIWRLHDQVSMCKEGHKTGVSSRLQNHTPAILTDLNLIQTTDSPQRKPARSSPQGTRTRVSPQTSPQIFRTPPNASRRAVPARRGGLSPRLGTIVEDGEVAGSSRATYTETLQTPPRHSLRLSRSTARDTTPGKISAYFKSAEKTQSPSRRHSNRLQTNNVTATIPFLYKGSPSKTNKQSPSKTNKQSPSKTNKQSPKKTESPKTPSKSPAKQPKSPVKQPKSPVKQPKSPAKQPKSPVKRPKTPVKSPKTPTKRATPTKTRTSPRFATTSTQTTAPTDCNAACRGCCKDYKSPKTKYLNIPTVSPSVAATPSTVDLTPRSCSNSSVPRRKRLPVCEVPSSSISETPTKGNTHFVRRSDSTQSPRGSSHSSSVKVRRKFTTTGTPIHATNCKCSFCLSACTELSQLSSSPIQEMPDRPKKRSIVIADTGNSPKRRKSLFEHDPLGNSSSPYSQEKENLSSNAFKTPEKRPHLGCVEKSTHRVTVREWFDKLASSQTLAEGNVCEEKVSSEEHSSTHDHSQCSSIHCIRSYFTRQPP